MTRLRSIRGLLQLSFLLLPVVAFAQAKLDPPVKPVVNGTYTGNGKPAKLQFVTVEAQRPFNDRDAVTLVFTEKDPKGLGKPSFDAMFQKLGCALILNVFQNDGDIFGCQVVHTALQKSGFSSIGKIKMLQWTFSGGNLSGHVTTDGEQDAFDEKWNVDLTFAAPLSDKMRAALTAPKAPAPTPKKDEADEEATPAKPAGPSPMAKDLPLPADAKNVQMKATVEQIQCASALPVTTVAKDLSAKLKAKGWKASDGDLQGPKNAILKRSKDSASLTIMIQQAAPGCTVKIFAEGLDWTGVENTASSEPASATDSADDVEKQAQDLMRKALKDVPGQ
jgi:hypothetical protein